MRNERNRENGRGDIFGILFHSNAPFPCLAAGGKNDYTIALRSGFFFTTLSIERRVICEENRATAKERNFEMGPRRRWNSWLDGRLGLGGKKSNSGFRSRSLQIEEEDNIAPFLLSVFPSLSFPVLFRRFLPFSSRRWDVLNELHFK